MKPVVDFYEGLHQTDRGYSGGDYHMKSLWSSGALHAWAGRQGKSLRYLDCGCGKGIFIRDFVQGMERGWNIKPARVMGIDLVQNTDNVFKEIPNFEFRLHDTDGNPLPFEDASFDFISCNHVLEHVFETEKLVREFRRVLAPDGLCIISVPNIAAWVNRALFIFGSQPLGSELGTEKTTYGFWPTSMQKKLEPFHPSGHIRDFTPRGLQNLTEHCGFKVVGWWPQSHGFIARCGKWAGRAMSIMLQKKV
jgi:ubiquinone/menaquinone biosynthesis C-methylase UbiE